MANTPLPEEMKNWKVESRISASEGKEVYSVVRENSDGVTKHARLTRITLEGSLYSPENVEYVKEESGFINSISRIKDLSNYINSYAVDNPDEEKLDLLILTDDSKPLTEVKSLASMSEEEVVDFGMGMSDVLEKLEKNNMYHGNIKPENIYVKADGSYALGGFTGFESNTDDPSYLSPEIQNGEKPDFTTDIYSLGLIMYSMCNGGKLPFEDEGLSKEDAAEKRLSISTVSAPALGSEKLRSVIVIACQSQNKNRWKNAGNLKKALTSIKSELPSSLSPAAQVIVPEGTDFDGNVFEESGDGSSAAQPFDEADAAQAEKTDDTPKEPETAAEPDEAESGAPADTDDAIDADKPETFDDEPEIDNRVFDDYDAHKTRIFNINSAMPASDKDYGDYFDYDEKPKEDVKSKTDGVQTVTVPVDDNYDKYDYDPLRDTDDEEKKSNKGLIIGIIVGALIILGLLAVIGVYAYNSGLLNKLFNTGETQPTTSAAEQQTTAAPPVTTAPQETTVPVTTVKPTEKPKLVSVPSVIGYDSEYAVEVLEDAGFSVEIDDYLYSEDYDEGLVISQNPEEEEEVKKGSTIYLTVSLGYEEEEEETTAPRREERHERQSEPEPVFSSYKNNTSYLTQAEVDAMSKKELELALNEVYARRGRIFTSPELAEYFSKQSWYKPTYTAEEFAEKVVFNDYEQKNITMLYNKLYN